MRLEGWEGRLAAAIEAARFKPFRWGEHDCFRFACSAVEALTGVDRWSRFAGYRTRFGALRIVAKHAGSFKDFVSLALGVELSGARLARVGDVVLVPQPRLDALGVCVGRDVAVLFERELGFLPRSACSQCWKVG